MDSQRVYGIDLGTTYSCIAYVDEASGKPSLVPNSEGELITPSVVLFEDADTRVVGREAKRTAVLDADRVVEMVKRNMGAADWRWPFEGEEYSAEEISSYILRKIADDTAAHTGIQPTDVVITCPAYFGIAEREATAKAGQLAGLNVLEIINEPTAAAIAYGLHDHSDQVVLVYDLGGGTFDISVIAVKDGSVTVVATTGDHNLGGRNWDEQVVQHLAQEWMRETGSSDDPTKSRETLQDLWGAAEAAKRALTPRTETKVAISHDGQRAAVTLTRDQFDQLTQHLLENTITMTKSALEMAKEQGHGKIDRLLLVGGSTRMPQVAARLRQEFGLEPQLHDPDQSVAMGAAIYGQKLAIGQRIRTELAKELGTSADELRMEDVAPEIKERARQTVADEMGMRLPALKNIDDMTVTDVASHSFGVVAIKVANGVQKEFISNLVLAQDQVPAKQTQRYGTVAANQPEVELKIMESARRTEELADLAEAEEIGNAVLKLTAGLPEGAPIDVTFELTKDGRLRITGTDAAAGGQSVTAELETARGLSEEELAKATARASGIKVTG